MNEKIFIGIIALNEKDLNQTIKSAIANAYNPERLKFGISIQSFNKSFHNFDNINADITCVEMYHPAPIGVGANRLFSTLLNDNSCDFYLQVDAHMLFEKNWDKDLIYYYNKINEKYSKPVISTYVPFWYEENNEIKLCINKNIQVDPYNFSSGFKKNVKLKIDDFEEGLPRKYPKITGEDVSWQNNKEYEEHYLTSGHFLFTTIDYVYNIMQDPFFGFGPEELTLGIRLWTRGYNIFTINKPIVWHKNKQGDNLDPNDWRISSNVPDQKLNDIFYDKLYIGYSRAKDIFLGDEVGYWGATSQDSLAEYVYTTGYNFNEYYDMLKERMIKNNNILGLKSMYGIDNSI